MDEDVYENGTDGGGERHEWLYAFMANRQAELYDNQRSDQGEEERSDREDDEVNDYEAINNFYGYVAEKQEDSTDDETSCNYRDVVNNTKAREKARVVPGQRNYFEMPPIHVGHITGVKVQYTGGMHHWDRKMAICTRTAFQDADAELLACELE